MLFLLFFAAKIASFSGTHKKIHSQVLPYSSFCRMWEYLGVDLFGGNSRNNYFCSRNYETNKTTLL